MIEVTASKKKRRRPELARQERAMWDKWNTGGRKPPDLTPLLQSLQPVVQDHINRHWREGMRIPKEAVRAELENHMVSALKSYDPNRGTAVSSWVQWNMRKVSRYVKKHQNVARIASKRAMRIGDYQNAKAWLTQRLGREPTAFELSDELHWPVPDVERFERELVRDIPFSMSHEEQEIDALSSRSRQQLRLLQYEFQGKDQKSVDALYVLQCLTGTGGKPPMKATEIARAKGWSDAKVHRIRKRIEEKASKLLL